MGRMIAVAKIDGQCARSGLLLKKGEGYEIDEEQFDPTVFARPGEKIDEQAPAGDLPADTEKEGN
ncbi:MAG: hypothetical protein M0024_01300 [Nitrospiraceae bacterium]|nr:hypothetical protein [Nitrospiraceae bacterium]